MAPTASNNAVQVFFGSPIEHDSERRALGRMRRVLSQRNVRSRILVNFTVGHSPRQVDFLVVTDNRCVLVELKTVSQLHPLRGRANGFWEQGLADTTRMMDRNFFTQTREATFAVSDAMRDLDPNSGIKFYRHIDSILCLNPEIPKGSLIDAFPHTDVMSFTSLMDALSSEGRRPPWNESMWDEFVRFLGLYREFDDDPAVLKRRAVEANIQDYQRRFKMGFSAGLHEFVPLQTLEVGKDENELDLFSTFTSGESTVVLTGASGSGKSHLARHIALQWNDMGHLPVWLRCDEYEPGKLSILLARAMAPFSTENPVSLLQQALDSGFSVLLILDSLNSCSEDLRVELLQQVSAVQLRLPSSILITSTKKPVELAEPSWTEVMIKIPDDQERRSLLASHGAPEIVSAPAAFRTPLELSLAAACYRKLNYVSTVTDLFDTYIQQVAPSEVVRSGLRRIASLIDEDLRTSVSLTKAYSALRRLFLNPENIDATMASGLLVIRQGTVRFAHELFGRFLVAEQLVLTATDNEMLARALREPTHLDLWHHAVVLERDIIRRHELLILLAKEDLLANAAQGVFGSATADKMLDKMRSLLEQASADVSTAFIQTDDPEDFFQARWKMSREWTAEERAQFTAIGFGVPRGLLIEDVGSLLDHTDRACQRESRRLQDRGSRQAISVIVAVTYAMTNATGPAPLPASIVVDATHHGSLFLWGASDSVIPIAAYLYREANKYSWGRLYLAALLCHPLRHMEDAEILPELVRDGWEAQGYHLQLQVLMAAHSAAGRLNVEQQCKMVDALNQCHPDHIFLSSQLVDTLAAYGEIEPLTTLEEIQQRIDSVLHSSSDPRSPELALSIISSTMENQNVIGPYSEAVYSLPRQSYVQLLALAAQADQAIDSFSIDWIMGELADAAMGYVEIVKPALSLHVVRTPRDDPFLQCVTEAHLEAIRGWSTISLDLPGVLRANGDDFDQVWRCYDTLIFSAHRAVPVVGKEADYIWGLLLNKYPSIAVNVLHQISITYQMSQKPRVLDLLFSTYHAPLVHLLEWSSEHLDYLTDSSGAYGQDRIIGFIFLHLGRFGTSTTVERLRSLLQSGESQVLVVEAIRSIESRSH